MLPGNANGLMVLNLEDGIKFIGSHQDYLNIMVESQPLGGFRPAHLGEPDTKISNKINFILRNNWFMFSKSKTISG